MFTGVDVCWRPSRLPSLITEALPVLSDMVLAKQGGCQRAASHAELTARIEACWLITAWGFIADKLSVFTETQRQFSTIRELIMPLV